MFSKAVVQYFNTAVVLTTLITVLSGCGGGGGGDGNQGPIAVDDTAQTNQATSININVIANDSDPDGVARASGITLKSQPANGSAVANSDGTVTYTPNASYAGPNDSFTYTVSDDLGAVSNIAIVTVAINARPTAVDDNASTNQTIPVIIDVVANDDDSDGTVQADSVTILSNPPNGSVATNGDGTVTYTPNAGYPGPSDSFIYTVADNQGAVSNVATVIVTINARPTAVDDSAPTNQAVPVIINVIANDSDSDGLQASSISIQSPPANGGAAANTDGTVTYTPDAGYAGPSDSFTYTVQDNLGAVSNAATVTVTINAGPVAANDSAQTNQAVLVIIPVIANDSDSDGLQANSISIQSPPANGGAAANANGTVTYIPDAGYAGPSDSFTYTVADTQGAVSNIATVTVAINAGPTAGDDSAQTSQDTQVIINVLGNDSDSDGLQASSVTIQSGASIGSTAVNTIDGTITYTPNAGYSAPSDSFTYTVEDTQGAVSNIATVTVAINQNPLAPNMCDTTPQESAFMGTLPGSDPDTSPGGLTFSLNADGSGFDGPITTTNGHQVVITDNTTGAFIYTPSSTLPIQRGADTFEYHVEDTEGGSASAVVTIIIDPRIMPVGDSITQGITTVIPSLAPPVTTRIGYRERLYSELGTSGFSVDFVGNRNIGGNVAGFDPDSEGYAGAKDEEIAFVGGADAESGDPIPAIYDMLQANPADIVLLHIGTNDINLDPADTSATDVQSILTEINRWEDSANGNPVAVVLARIVDQCVNLPTDCGSGEPATIAFNNNVANMATSLGAVAGPDEVIIVDQRSVLLNGSSQPDANLYATKLHPNQAGYDLMADAWLDSLTGVVVAPEIMASCSPP